MSGVVVLEDLRLTSQKLLETGIQAELSVNEYCFELYIPAISNFP
jgi:hypothetical protein